MRNRYGFAAMVALLVAGCGTATSPLAGSRGAVRAFEQAPIVDLTGVPLGVPLNLVGKYQSYKLTGSGTINALDAAHLAVSAHLVAHFGFITQSKDVTFAVTGTGDAQWPFQFTAVNVTDNKTFANKAALVSHTGGTSTFKVDDNTTAVIAASGKGDAQIVFADFTMMMGKNALSMPFLSPVENPPAVRPFFDLP